MSTTQDLIEPQTSAESYDEMNYPGGAFRPSHPTHMAMVGTMCGLTPADPKTCRVLELGSSMGSNLIPMAMDLPNATFVGIDFAESQIKRGKEIIQQLGLKNIELKHMSITDIDETLGEFDYIICHGVYSWVDSDVQKAILNAGKSLLSPNGIEYVSYNVFPGWHMRGVVREMMRYHTQDFDTPQKKVAQARGMLDFIKKYAKSHSEAFSHLLTEEAKMLENSLDSYIYHEHLEEVNEPLYFHQFVDRVDQAGLRYLSDAHITSMIAQMFDPEAAEMLRNAPLLKREQYMDFLRGRVFRSSLICHQDLNPDYTMPPTRVDSLSVSLRRPMLKVEDDELADSQTAWRNPQGKLTTEGSITDVIVKLNQAFPSPTDVSDLLSAVDENGHAVIRDVLMMGFIKGIFQLAKSPVSVEKVVSEKPKVSPYAQWQASNGNRVTNRLHFDYTLQPQQRFLVANMDGEKTVDELAALLKDEISAGRLGISKKGETVDTDKLDVGSIVKVELNAIRALGMLVD